MITKISVICGKILELLEQNNGVFVFGEIQSRLKEPHDLALMGLGWLLREGYIRVIKDPVRVCYKNGGEERYSSEASMFDLIVENKYAQSTQARVKHMEHEISMVAEKILILLEGCGLLDLQTIERHLNEHRDIVLMGLGWLVREGHVHWINGAHKIPMFRLQKQPLETALLCCI
jgi:hypothetical protein